MIEPDTIKLLRECDAGIKMGVKSIDDVLDRVESDDLKQLLNACKDAHDKLDKELQQMLDSFGDDGKDPSFISEKMAKMKTEVKLQMDASDNTIADLMTDGCNMGVKSLNKYLNQYAAADEQSKDITKRLINLEAQLAVDMRKFL
ncbi:MAG: PA2169 family four-helix-bundle protein [Eubacterium sp.]|nr:PA2169 family four-helix-bundle protein [Eubacterium sp.]